MSKIITTGFISDKINGIAVNSSIKGHRGNYADDSGREVSYVVMHYTGNEKDTAKNNALYFKNNDVDVSAHFFVDDSNIYQSIELRDKAWHCGTDGKYYHKVCRNSNSFSIEMCCTGGNYKISDKTVENSAHLCAHLCKMLGITDKTVDTYVLRHYDITHKKCPAQMVENAKEWTAFKTKVKNILKGSKSDDTTSTKSDGLYRVRKSWDDPKSQIGAFKNLTNAKSQVNRYPGYSVFDNKGKKVYPVSDKKTLDALAKEVINGKWGNGTARKNAITKAYRAGQIAYGYDEIQKRVNELV
jgi:N-acetylmuramoyl-L-alanine amidase CwlA